MGQLFLAPGAMFDAFEKSDKSVFSTFVDVAYSASSPQRLVVGSVWVVLFLVGRYKVLGTTSVFLS